MNQNNKHKADDKRDMTGLGLCYASIEDSVRMVIEPSISDLPRLCFETSGKSNK
jgi:hypothetical protein